MSLTIIIILIIGTLVFIYLTWFASIKARRYHVFYRFFSFESIFIIVLMNYQEWFKDPFSIIQIISWILLICSAILPVWGFYLLYKKGKPKDQIENTSLLVTAGLYKYIRHPLYLSLLLGGFGALLKDPGIVQIILAIINTIALIFTATVEEKEMLKKFGDEYADYIKNTKMFFPYIL